MTIHFPGAPGIGIVGTGAYLPAEIVSNETVAARAGVTDDWIVRKTAIRSRRYAARGEATSDLAAEAARAALRNAGLRADEISWIIVATSTPDQPQPATACLVQSLIGAHNAAAFDVNAVCSGFVFALAAGTRLLAQPHAGCSPGYALVIGADVYSRIIDPTDRRTAVLFGDGAGAVVLGPVGSRGGLLGFSLASYGGLSHLIAVPAGGSREPASRQTLADNRHSFKMDGRGVKEFVTAELPKAVTGVLHAHGMSGWQVDHFIPHQANGAMLHDIVPKLGLPQARTTLTVAEHGNTSAASIPLAIHQANTGRLLKEGELVLLAGFGGGMSLGTALLRWSGSRQR
ncbi:3-oxoacyl-ACP synthase III family protein [Streptomyces sp. TRM68367]|uniref:3-oxoacyl-ACP synthase III family protein n=1 Tax=Streptomyces sp. TRM68367 TaxID=2758415 RepID=UPI00165BC57C|nr:beta-ketoacyl-ACP synthase 3 [Streptomyces sp. TRM68367]MBC9725835.1 beta-ketoacyl-ACP synthase 3 [Streptomyces sp. TRM68367]